MKTNRIFQIASLVLLGVAAYFFWQENSDYAFFFGVLAACSFFLNIKYRAKERLAVLDKEPRA